MNQHLVVVEGFEHLNDPRSYIVRGLIHLVGSPKANWSQVTGQTKSGSNGPDDKEYNKVVKVKLSPKSNQGFFVIESNLHVNA